MMVDQRFVVGITKDRTNIIVWMLGEPEPRYVLSLSDWDSFMVDSPEWASIAHDILNLAQLLGWESHA